MTVMANPTNKDSSIPGHWHQSVCSVDTMVWSFLPLIFFIVISAWSITYRSLSDGKLTTNVGEKKVCLIGEKKNQLSNGTGDVWSTVLCLKFSCCCWHYIWFFFFKYIYKCVCHLPFLHCDLHIWCILLTQCQRKVKSITSSFLFISWS